MKLRLTLQVKTSPSGRTINVEIIDFIPPEYLLSRATRLASTALQCSQVASGKDPSGVIAVSLGCFQPCFPQRIPTIQSAGIIYYNYNYNYIYIYIYFLFVSLHVMPILWRHWHNQDLCENPHTVAVVSLSTPYHLQQLGLKVPSQHGWQLLHVGTTALGKNASRV